MSKVNVSMYNFGSPRVGNRIFSQIFNSIVPDSFRVVVDGDMITSMPYARLGYKHIGTEILLDAQGSGSIIIDPSFIERRLKNKSKSSVSVHSLEYYRRGLFGVKDSSEYIKNNTSLFNSPSDINDHLQVALMYARFSSHRTTKLPEAKDKWPKQQPSINSDTSSIRVDLSPSVDSDVENQTNKNIVQPTSTISEQPKNISNSINRIASGIINSININGSKKSNYFDESFNYLVPQRKYKPGNINNNDDDDDDDDNYEEAEDQINSNLPYDYSESISDKVIQNANLFENNNINSNYNSNDSPNISRNE